MYLVIIGWLYVTLMMAAAEAFSSNGSLLGAIVTLFLYGLMPVALLLYFSNRRSKKGASRLKAGAPDDCGHAPGAAEPDSVTAVRKEP